MEFPSHRFIIGDLAQWQGWRVNHSTIATAEASQSCRMSKVPWSKLLAASKSTNNECGICQIMQVDHYQKLQVKPHPMNSVATDASDR
jgi:hypothetical protein